MRLFIMFFVTMVVLSVSGCNKKDESTPTQSDEQSSQYTNKLTLGTSMVASAFTLGGETSTFTRQGGTAAIFYRLESAADFAGAGVSIKIEKQSGSSYSTIGTYPYANPQAYGHIIMSAFAVTDAGSYRATGLITASGASIASTTFTVQ